MNDNETEQILRAEGTKFEAFTRNMLSNGIRQERREFLFVKPGEKLKKQPALLPVPD